MWSRLTWETNLQVCEGVSGTGELKEEDQLSLWVRWVYQSIAGILGRKREKRSLCFPPSLVPDYGCHITSHLMLPHHSFLGTRSCVLKLQAKLNTVLYAVVVKCCVTALTKEPRQLLEKCTCKCNLVSVPSPAAGRFTPLLWMSWAVY